MKGRGFNFLAKYFDFDFFYQTPRSCTKLGWVGWVLGMSYGDKAGSGGPRVLGAKSWWVGRGSHHALHNFFSLPPAWLKLFKLSTFTFLRQINSYFTSSLSSIIKIQSITINVMKIQRECTTCETRQIMKWWVLQQGMEELIIEGKF